MTTPALEIDRLAKRYGKLPVLESLTLTVTRGECFGLVGMNGAGKTTLIKCLLDFCDIDGGQIRIMGTPHRETRARKPLAYLPESFLPPHSLTGRDFVKYMLALREQPYDEPAARAMCAALDLDAQALDRQARSYSKGMTQKLGLAAGFLSQAELFILDEPMSGLDPKARALLKRQFAAFKQSGKTLFFSSHVLADVEEICDRMAILHAGQLRFIGTPDECRGQYQTDTLEAAYLTCIA
ncbi:MAG: ABC transporter ATP-binding protein [Hydrogenophilales bacterium]|nr:ABC transporter ATP-binding protein [Hydrogenophilales bacterium]